MFKAFVLATSLCLLIVTNQFANSAELELGFRINLGTYTVPVKIPGVGTRQLTFDTGASYTVLDKKDISPLNLRKEQRVGVYLPHEGKRKSAIFVTIPKMKIGDCTLLNRKVVVMSLPEGRPGALGMSELEEISPFTFVGNGILQFQCPKK